MISNNFKDSDDLLYERLKEIFDNHKDNNYDLYIYLGSQSYDSILKNIKKNVKNIIIFISPSNSNKNKNYNNINDSNINIYYINIGLPENISIFSDNVFEYFNSFYNINRIIHNDSEKLVVLFNNGLEKTWIKKKEGDVNYNFMKIIINKTEELINKGNNVYIINGFIFNKTAFFNMDNGKLVRIQHGGDNYFFERIPYFINYIKYIINIKKFNGHNFKVILDRMDGNLKDYKNELFKTLDYFI
jgi:hypothetical protein